MTVMRLAFMLAAPLLLGSARLAIAQPVFDHMTCFKIGDPVVPRVGYTMDVNPKELDRFAPMPGDRVTGGVYSAGCQIVLPAKYFCIDVEVANARQTRAPYTAASWLAAGPDPGDRLCYKLKCPGGRDVSYPVVDQFGTRTIKVRRQTAFLCTPAWRQVTDQDPCQSNANGICQGLCPDGNVCLGVTTQSCGCAPPASQCGNMSSGMCGDGLCPGLWEFCGATAGACGCLHP
ncbi:MAG: hypothetical protein KIT14_22745 [bacterium]|nr:hypothetical protein [bacterium]